MTGARVALAPRALAALAFAFAALAGCTFEDGAWFAELEPELQARYQPAADRVVDGGFQRLASGYEVALDRAELEVGSVELVGAGSGSAAFDPARPPPGYSLCHGGHCHADDGRLVPYAEIEAELAGGKGATAPPVLTLGGGRFDLLASAGPVPLGCPAGGCRLGHTRVVKARAAPSALRLAGRVRSGPGAPAALGERPFTVDLTPASGLGPIEGTLDLPADNRHPPGARVHFSITLGPQLFDRLDWPAFPNDTGLRQLADAVRESPLTARVDRFDP